VCGIIFIGMLYQVLEAKFSREKIPHRSSAMKTEKSLVAGGCFWCVQSAFDAVPGVIGCWLYWWHDSISKLSGRY